MGIWLLTYPDNKDPKNLKYVLWKAGLYKVDVDVALSAMVGDRNCKIIIIGKSKKQLEYRFGYLLPPSQAGKYYFEYYKNSVFCGKDALFIRDSPWMVIFDGERANELILVKGY
jgi:hypothetical protein